MRSSFLALGLVFVSAVASAAEMEPPSPLLSGGFRFQTVDRGTRPDLFLGGVNLLMFKTQVGDQGAFWSFVSPGLHYQFNGDRKIAVSVAPVSYVGKSGLALALQVFPFDAGRAGGLFGLSVGAHFF
jgi:hypothetical protein